MDLSSAPYRLAEPDTVFSPGLLFYPEMIRRNIAEALRVAGSPERLRPHVKTHKCAEIVHLQLAKGITKHKCATIAEAEMLARCGVPDVLIAYPLVGPNVGRLVALTRAYPGTRFLSLIDHPKAARALSDGVAAAGLVAPVLMDVDVGHHRTGIPASAGAADLYRAACDMPGLKPLGIQAYDGHNHQNSRDVRQAAVDALLGPVLELRAQLERSGCPVPILVCGGTPTFPMFAAANVPGLECSPGTLVLNDAGYGSRYADMAGFVPAAALLTRVVSKPAPDQLTFDLGNKAVAADPPLGRRVALLDIPEYEHLMHNEEHLGIRTPLADRYEPGDAAYALPMHVCPTCALHREAHVVEGGRVVARWAIASRDRVIGV